MTPAERVLAEVGRCGACSHWDPHGPREVESVTSGDCERLTHILYFTYHHPPYAGGSTVDSIETARTFGCTEYVAVVALDEKKEG